jgi:hypothetical protein
MFSELLQGLDVMPLGAAGGTAEQFGNLPPGKLPPNPQHDDLASVVG